MKNYDEILREAIRRYGIARQTDKAQEEMAELTVALQHLKYGRGCPEDVVTEIADVTIMIYQLAVIFGLEKVTAEVDRKLARLEGRLAGDAE